MVEEGHVAYHSIRSDETNILVPFSSSIIPGSKGIDKNIFLPQAYNSAVKNWPDLRSRGHENDKSEIYVL